MEKTSTVGSIYRIFFEIEWVFSIRTQNKMHFNGENNKINLWPRNPFNKYENQKGFVDIHSM